MMIMIDDINDDDDDYDYENSNNNNNNGESHAFVSTATRCDHAEGMQVEAR